MGKKELMLRKRSATQESVLVSLVQVYSTDLDIIFRSAFFYDWDHVDEEKKKEIKHQSGKLEGKPKQPNNYSRSEFSVQLPHMSAKCMVAHRHKSFVNGIEENRNFRTLVQYRLLQGLHMHQRC